MTEEEIFAETLALSRDARALLADKLEESLRPADDVLILSSWAKEAKRRRDELRTGNVKTIPGNEALAM